MGALALAYIEEVNDKYAEIVSYLSTEGGGYFLENDIWYLDHESFEICGIKTNKKKWILADFTGYQSQQLKNEMKYYLLYSMKEKYVTAIGVCSNYRRAIQNIGSYLSETHTESFEGLPNKQVMQGLSEIEENVYRALYTKIIDFITELYDERPEFERDIWHIDHLQGVKQSAIDKRSNHSIRFEEVPIYYRLMVKRYLLRILMRRSYSHCHEMLVYIKYFFKVFYENGYTDGFFEHLSRKDMEKYLHFVAIDYKDKNATFTSKAVSFIRIFIDYIQLAEYEGAPKCDVYRLLFDDDVPRRERANDTMNKVKYIPTPVKDALDANIKELEPKEMQPIYILLRESGWRGADIFNLRYDTCLEYLWNEKEQSYIPYLCGEITKTGIPILKIPIRKEVGEIVKELSTKVKEISTEDNNPSRYLFNTYEGRNKGKPYSKDVFVKSVRKLIEQKQILDGDGKLYHFKTHSLRHTRAMEYTEQEMPIGIIQQILGHCSLQMTLHYSRVSENMLYEKWKKTEELKLLQLDSRPPAMKEVVNEEGLHYEFVRKNLDAVKVPFGMCFKPMKIPCKQQMNHCLECANFCSDKDNIKEYRDEIERVKEHLRISKTLGRDEWVVKNQTYLEILESMLARIQTEGTVHKNGILREDCNG